MIKEIEEYIKPIQKANNHRFLSWQHCYEAFGKFDYNKDKDILSLHLAFYLASWGMYRGSSGLLWKDYRIHYPTIDILCKYQELRNNYNLEKINNLYNELKSYYDNIEYNNGKKSQIKNVSPTTTLISKIMLGTLGCSPAFDRYFLKGIGINTNSFPILIENVKKIIDSDEKIAEIEECQVLIKQKLNFDYPSMKIIDMFYWQKGYTTLNI